MVRVIVLFLLLLAGCAAAPPPTSVSPSPSTPPSVVPAGRVRITFDTFDCFCHLSGVEYALLELPTVTGLDWNLTEYRVTLAVKDPPPTDAQIDDALLYTGVKISRIDRP